ncbi:MAG: hypothetical protein J6U56_02175 [Spirochaetia bacterium]|nr:hypothetical protein [Spirochaetia bacterium]
MFKKLVLALLIVLVALTSCSKAADDSYLPEMEALVKEKTGDDLLQGFIDLDKKYPNVLMLKINISGMLLMKNEVKLAGEYLKAGLPLAKKSASEGEKYVFYTNMAQYSLKSQDPNKSIEYAKQALSFNKEDPLGVTITMAKAYANKEDPISALKLMKELWAADHNKFTDEDMFEFISLLGNEPDSVDNVTIIVAVLDEYIVRRPGVLGFGMQQAQCLEQAGYITSAFIATYAEMDRMRFINKVTDENIIISLESAKSNFENTSLPHVKFLDGFKAYMEEDFDTASEIFDSITPEVPLNYYSYLQMACRANSSKTSPDLVNAFGAMEGKFPLFQGYYYYLWTSIRKNNLLSKEDQPLMEHCILSNPNSRFGVETKKALGRLYGLDNGENILLPDELAVYLMRVRNGEKPDILEPVAKFLEMPDNPFKENTALLIPELKKIPAVAEWLNKRLGM